MTRKIKVHDRLVRLYWFIVAMFVSFMLCVTPVAAADNTIWTQVSAAVKDVYGQILGISTLVAVTAAAVALIVRMVSRNQRAVDEATSWLKRIVITWIILNSLGFVIAYLQGFMTGGQYTVT